MLKLNASFSKKVPGTQQYSSEGFMASVEVEIPDGLNEQQLKDNIRDCEPHFDSSKQVLPEIEKTSTKQSVMLQLIWDMESILIFRVYSNASSGLLRASFVKGSQCHTSGLLFVVMTRIHV